MHADSMLYQYLLTATNKGPNLADVSLRVELMHQIFTATLGKVLLLLIKKCVRLCVSELMHHATLGKVRKIIT